jgi:hypothetical protein
MSLDSNMYYQCPMDQEDAILLVDVETETIPATDEDGNMLYYCTEGQHIFAVDEDKALI